MYTSEEAINKHIKEIMKYGYSKIDDGISVFEAQVIESMVEDKLETSFILSRTINGLPDFAKELSDELYKKHARSMVIDALASVEKGNE